MSYRLFSSGPVDSGGVTLLTLKPLFTGGDISTRRENMAKSWYSQNPLEDRFATRTLLERACPGEVALPTLTPCATRHDRTQKKVARFSGLFFWNVDSPSTPLAQARDAASRNPCRHPTVSPRTVSPRARFSSGPVRGENHEVGPASRPPQSRGLGGRGWGLGCSGVGV